MNNARLTPCVLCLCSPKSTAAAKAAKGLNDALKVTALQNRVSPATEDVFHDKFWESLDLIVNALDNVNARLYVDSRCVYFGKALLESGTLGPKCNTQVVMPNMTENYGKADLPAHLPCLARNTLHGELKLNRPRPGQTCQCCLSLLIRTCTNQLLVCLACQQWILMKPLAAFSRMIWSEFPWMYLFTPDCYRNCNWLVCGAL